jgi:hypothetical protein
MSDDPIHNRRSEDHDLLIRLDEKVEALIKSVAGLTDDHETRIRRIERWGAIAVGALYMIEAYFKFIKP